MLCAIPARPFLVLVALAGVTTVTALASDNGTKPADVRLNASTQQPETQDKTLPLNLAYAQDGAPLHLRGYLANAGSYFYETATVENISGRDVSAVTFGVTLIDQDERGVRVLLRTDPIPVSLASGQTETVNVHLLSVKQFETFYQMFKKPQAMLGVLRVEWVDGTNWRADLPADADDFANTGKVAEVSEWQIHAETPTGAPEAQCYDDAGAAYSSGAVVPVKGRSGRLAACVNGGWADYPRNHR